MDFLTFVGEKLNLLDFLPYNYEVSKTMQFMCSFFDGLMCELIFGVIEGDPIYGIDDMTRTDVYQSYLPTDAGAYNFKHYGQLMRQDGHRFRRYDYGKDINLKKYNQTEAPDYQLSNINFPIAIFYGKYDKLADPVDVQWLITQLGSNVIFHQEYEFGHLSFAISKDMSYFTDTAMGILNKYNFEMNSEQTVYA